MEPRHIHPRAGSGPIVSYLCSGARLAPDGYQYGVMFSDGSVWDRWNGRTQRERAAATAAILRDQYPPDNITLARRLPGQSWERVE